MFRSGSRVLFDAPSLLLIRVGMMAFSLVGVRNMGAYRVPAGVKVAPESGSWDSDRSHGAPVCPSSRGLPVA